MSQNDPSGTPDDAELSRRLSSLGSGLKTVEARKGNAPKPGGQSAGMSGLGQAMRLSTEFIAGIIVGGGAGWAFDRWLGTGPWGMIVLLLLGTCAGFFNVARTAGLMKSRTSDKSGRN